MTQIDYIRLHRVQKFEYIFISDWSVESESIPCVARLGTRGLGCEWHLAFLRKVVIPHIERALKDRSTDWDQPPA